MKRFILIPIVTTALRTAIQLPAPLALAALGLAGCEGPSQPLGVDRTAPTPLFSITGTEMQITTDPARQRLPAISGDRIVWSDRRNGNWDIYMYDLATGTESQITTDPTNQGRPTISGDRIVWSDGRNGNSDIYMYDLVTATETQITTDPAAQTFPAISGDRIVWGDNRNGPWDIYMYDLATGTETRITTNPSSDRYPKISGDRIVWSDGRNGDLGDIYMYDLATGTETRITTDPRWEFQQDISGDRIVWLQHLTLGNYDVYMYDLATATVSQIGTMSELVDILDDNNSPALSGDRIVWMDIRGDWDIYMVDLATGTENQITTDPYYQCCAAISGDRIVWVDERNGNEDIYLFELSADDGDGIEADVDKEPLDYSSDFSDEPLGGQTYGTIVDRGDQAVRVADSPFTEPGLDGVLAEADPSGGLTPAHISACGGSDEVFLDPGESQTITCGSVTVKVTAGSVENLFYAEDGTQVKATLSEGNGLRFRPADLSFTALETNREDVVVILGEEEYKIPAGGTVSNFAPAADPGDPQYGYEGSQVGFDGSLSTDPDGDGLTYEWDFGDGATGTGIIAAHAYRDNGTYTICLTVGDEELTDTGCTTVQIENVAPTLGPVTAPSEPTAVGTSATVGAEFTDPGKDDTHTATIDWGDGTVSPATVTETDGSGSVAGSHSYAAAGVYTATATVVDDDGGAAASVSEYVVVYDPAGGFVTGGGWIDSPERAFKPDPNLVGKANFGFVSKYKKGTTELTGKTEFQFRVGDLNFHSTGYEWLVVTGGDYAKFKGSGTINGAGDYQFMVWAGDRSLDTFRIRIWEEDESTGVETDIYDNGFNQPVGGGSIVVHVN